MTDKIKLVKDLAKKKHFSFYEKDVIEKTKRVQPRLVLDVFLENNEKGVLKLLVSKSEKDKSNFLRELKIISRINKKDATLTNKIIDSSSGKEKWMLLNYLEGDIAGNIFKFKEEYQTKDLIDYLCESLKTFSALKIFKVQKSDLTNAKEQVLAAIKLLDSKNHPLASSKEKVEAIYEKNISFLTDLKNYRFSHNDLSPLNIVIGNDQYSIIDWELSGMHLKTFDAAYIAQRSWGNESWQKDFEKKVFSGLLAKADESNYRFWQMILLIIDLDTFVNKKDSFVFKHGQHFEDGFFEEMAALYLQKAEGLIKLLS